MHSSNTTPKRYCVILNNNHKVSTPFTLPPLSSNNSYYSVKLFNTCLTKFALNKFKYKYKISKKKLKLFLEDGTNLLTDYNPDTNIDTIDEFDNHIQHCINIYVSNGESFTKNILNKREVIEHKKDENVLIKQVPNALLPRLIGRKKSHFKSIAGTIGISGAVLAQTDEYKSKYNETYEKINKVWKLPTNENTIDYTKVNKNCCQMTSEYDYVYDIDIDECDEIDKRDFIGDTLNDLESNVNCKQSTLILVGSKNGIKRAKKIADQYINGNRNIILKEDDIICSWIGIEARKEAYINRKVWKIKKMCDLAQIWVIGSPKRLNYFCINHPMIRDEVPDDIQYPVLYIRATSNAIKHVCQVLDRWNIKFLMFS